MDILNVEIKARCSDPGRIRSILKDREADFRGTDHQVDTYFNVRKGRLKLREGTIENNLIFYHRTNINGPKPSNINLIPVDRSSELKSLLTNALGVKAVVDKQREIYFIDNVKFHIDRIAGLGSFVEIEAIDRDGTTGEEKLYRQCRHYLSVLEIEENDLIAASYSDLLVAENK